jgi:hypothetical protein
MSAFNPAAASAENAVPAQQATMRGMRKRHLHPAGVLADNDGCAAADGFEAGAGMVDGYGRAAGIGKLLPLARVTTAKYPRSRHFRLNFLHLRPGRSGWRATRSGFPSIQHQLPDSVLKEGNPAA